MSDRIHFVKKRLTNILYKTSVVESILESSFLKKMAAVNFLIEEQTAGDSRGVPIEGTSLLCCVSGIAIGTPRLVSRYGLGYNTGRKKIVHHGRPRRCSNNQEIC